MPCTVSHSSSDFHFAVDSIQFFTELYFVRLRVTPSTFFMVKTRFRFQVSPVTKIADQKTIKLNHKMQATICHKRENTPQICKPELTQGDLLS